MEKFERKFSKELAQETRDETAQKLSEARKHPTDFNSAKKNPEILTYNETKEIAQEMQKITWGRLVKNELWREKVTRLEELLAIEKENKLKEIQKEYKNKIDAIMKTSPLTSEEQEKYLNEETLKSMSLENYLVLMKRLSGNYLSHVSRYGIREKKNTEWFHQYGIDEFHDSFEKILGSKTLHSFKVNFIEDNYPISIVDEYISQNISLPENELIENAYKLVIESDFELDKDSVHMALNTKTLTYGAEGNFYFYFPSEVIGYNYYHKTRWGEGKNLQSYDSNRNNHTWNDYEIFNFNEGIPINVGITCIPCDLEVDRETGSQYKLVDGNPVFDDQGNLIKASNTITSREYWEAYFKKYPSKRPSKIIWGNIGSYAIKNEGYDELFTNKDVYSSQLLENEKYKEYETEINLKLKEKIKETVKEARNRTYES